jgi:hypothetical protein
MTPSHAYIPGQDQRYDTGWHHKDTMPMPTSPVKTNGMTRHAYIPDQDQRYDTGWHHKDTMPMPTSPVKTNGMTQLMPTSPIKTNGMTRPASQRHYAHAYIPGQDQRYDNTANITETEYF